MCCSNLFFNWTRCSWTVTSCRPVGLILALQFGFLWRFCSSFGWPCCYDLLLVWTESIGLLQILTLPAWAYPCLLLVRIGWELFGSYCDYYCSSINWSQAFFLLLGPSFQRSLQLLLTKTFNAFFYAASHQRKYIVLLTCVDHHIIHSLFNTKLILLKIALSWSTPKFKPNGARHLTQSQGFKTWPSQPISYWSAWVHASWRIFHLVNRAVFTAYLAYFHSTICYPSGITHFN